MLSLLLLLCGGVPQTGEVTAYHAAEIWTMGDGAAYAEDSCLVVSEGKVIGVVPFDEIPFMARVVELGNAVVVPGLVAADASDFDPAQSSVDSLGAHRRAIDGFDPYRRLDYLLARGVTTFYLAPARDRLVGGRGAVVRSAGEDRLLSRQSDLRITLDEAAWNPPSRFDPPIPPSSDNPLGPPITQAPTSRAGAMLALRTTAARAAAGEEFSAHLAALADWQADATNLLRIEARERATIEAAFRLAGEWGHPLVLDGAIELPSAARLAALQAGQPGGAVVVIDLPVPSSWRTTTPDAPKLTPSALQSVAELGPALTPEGPFAWAMLLEVGATAIGYGLSEEAALAGITRQAARALGVADRVGSLTPGLDADFLVLDGAPFDPATYVRRTYIEGRPVWQHPEEHGDPGIVIRAGTLWTGSGEPLRGGAEVLLRDGKIEAVGPTVPHPSGCRLVEMGEDAHLMPGLIDSRSRVGVQRTPDPTTVFGQLAAASARNRAFQSLAAAGVTTAVLAPARAANNGSAMSAVKTASLSPDGPVVRHPAAVEFRMANWSDRARQARDLRAQLAKGKSYSAKWQEYREKRAAWEAEQSSKQAAEKEEVERALRHRLAGSAVTEEAEQTEEESDVDEEVAEATKEVDPINGLWEAVIEDPRIPMPVTLNIRLYHEGRNVTALISSPEDPSGQTLELEGTWDGTTVALEFDTGMGIATLTGELDGPDHMSCRAELHGMGSIEFEASRIEIDEDGVAAKTKSRSRRADDGPQPPKVDGKLEAMRALFEGRTVALVEADREDDIRTAIAVFVDEFELPMHLRGGAEAEHLIDLLKEKGIGVVADDSLLVTENGRYYVLAAVLRAAGLTTALESNSASGGRAIAATATYAGRVGLGAVDALESLTSGPAEMFRMEDRVGRLAPGLDGDLVVLSGPPFDLRSRILKVFCEGREVVSE